VDTSALMTVDVQDGTRATGTSQFWSDRSDPLFLIPALADFYTWASEHHIPLSVATYRSYAAAHQGLPAVDLPGNELTTAVSRPHYRYHLTLAANAPALRLHVKPSDGSAPARVLTHADLYAAAAVCCDQIAARAQHFADTHYDLALPGGDPDTWTIRAAQYRVAQDSDAIRAAAANLRAEFLTSTFDCAHPAIEVAGVLVFGYLDPGGVLRVSVDLDEAEPWLQHPPHSTIPIRVSVNGFDVYAAS